MIRINIIASPRAFPIWESWNNIFCLHGGNTSTFQTQLRGSFSRIYSSHHELCIWFAFYCVLSLSSTTTSPRPQWHCGRKCWLLITSAPRVLHFLNNIGIKLRIDWISFKHRWNCRKEFTWPLQLEQQQLILRYLMVLLIFTMLAQCSGLTEAWRNRTREWTGLSLAAFGDGWKLIPSQANCLN